MKTKIRVKLPKLEKFEKTVNNDLRGSGNGPIRKALKQWAYRYRAFSRRRYLKQAGGGGAWAPLKQSTVRRRRKQSNRILIDTATMLGGFDPEFIGKPGQVESTVKFGIRVGVGGPAMHPGGINIGKLYRIHHLGLGRVPPRTLIVSPDQATITGMAQDMKKAMKEASS